MLWLVDCACGRMRARLRPRGVDGVARVANDQELVALRREGEKETDSPVVHVESAAASGTTLGMLVKDLHELNVEGPYIPDPERIRLLRHAENARGGMPIYPIDPGIGDEDWADWHSRWADEQVRFRNLISTIVSSRRWAKAR